MAKKILTYGTFDIIHNGHINLLERLRELSDIVIVGLSTDEFNSQKKNKTALMSYEGRKRVLESIRFVDLVIPEKTWEQKIEDVINHEVDIFAIGDDWEGKFDFLKKYCQVCYLNRTEGISSSSIRRLSSDLSHEHVRALSDAVDTMKSILHNFADQ